MDNFRLELRDELNIESFDMLSDPALAAQHAEF